MKTSKYKLFKWYLKRYMKNTREFIIKSYDWVCDIPKNTYQFYLDNFCTYLTICQSNEHVYVGRRLWEAIKEGMTNEDMADIRIWFKKYPTITKDDKFGYEYMMFINPDLKSYEREIFTAPLQFNVFGHIGFQSVQPTPAEIVYEYGIKCDIDDRVMLKVIPTTCNGEKAFILTRDVIGKPKPCDKYKEEDVELSDIIKQ